MKLTYCGIEDTSVKIFWEKTIVKNNEVVEMEETDALQLLNAYSNIFAPTLNKDAVKRLIKLNKDKEEARQKMIDTEIEEKLIREENAKKKEISILERKAKEKELAQKQAIDRQQKEIENINVAKKTAEDKKIEMKLQMEADKKIADERIKKVQETLITK